MCALTSSRLDDFEKILRNVTVCALTSSRLDDFSDMATYVIITIFFGGEAGHFWGKLLSLNYPR